jgi:hypothetical protein
MSLSKQDEDILNQIVDLDGKCMESTRCIKCPFRSMCLPEFLNPIPPTTQQRAKIALDVLAHHALVDEDLLVEDYKWNK